MKSVFMSSTRQRLCEDISRGFGTWYMNKLDMALCLAILQSMKFNVNVAIINHDQLDLTKGNGHLIVAMYNSLFQCVSAHCFLKTLQIEGFLSSVVHAVVFSLCCTLCNLFCFFTFQEIAAPPNMNIYSFTNFLSSTYLPKLALENPINSWLPPFLKIKPKCFVFLLLSSNVLAECAAHYIFVTGPLKVCTISVGCNIRPNHMN